MLMSIRFQEIAKWNTLICNENNELEHALETSKSKIDFYDISYLRIFGPKGFFPPTFNFFFFN